MKHLTLIRHAKSSWKFPGLDDLDRPLNSRGKHDAPVMGKKLAEQNFKPDLIISSPAKRARKTAKIIAKEIGYPEKKIVQEMAIYESNSSSLLEVIRQIDDVCENVVLFGHNPGFTDLSYELTNHDIGNIPTCGIFKIAFPIDSWKEVGKGTGRYVSFDYPKKYTG